MSLLSKAYLVAGVGGVGFFAMSVLLLGVWPGRVLENETRRLSPAHPLKLTVSEERGRLIYGREGCAYCHTQQVRMVAADEARFGKPTAAWETQFDYPHLWGTRRIGPDLSREGGLHPEDWQLTHLYGPQNVVPDSVMPGFPSLFEGGPERPLQAARDVVAYVLSLGRARALAEPAVGALQNFGEVSGGDGNDLYRHNCAGCHGAHGEGEGPGAAGLSPRPANLTEHEYSARRVRDVLGHGVRGSAMPAWREYPVEALTVTVRGFHRAVREPAPPGDVVELGRRVYAERCTQCHGEKGDGRGAAAGELAIAPTDFTGERPGVAESLRALRNGVAGTPMAPWNTKLNEAELSAVAYFVRGFFH